MADIYRRCGCRDENGKLLGTHCPRLASDPKHGTWSYYIAAGIDPKTGRRRQIRKSGFATKRDAQQARNEVAAKLDKGTYRAPSKLTYAAFLDGWFKRRQTTGDGLKETTVDNYARYIVNDIKPTALGRLQLTEIRRHHVNAFVDDLIDAGRGATTIRRIAAVVQGSLKDAAQSDLIDSNPAAGIRLPKVEKKDFEPWSPAQVGRFLDAAAEHRLGPLFEVALFTGMRRGELLGLHWSDVNLEARTITVRNNRTQARQRIVEHSPKTSAGRRIIDLSEQASAALLAWQITQETEAAEWGTAYERSGYVFTYENGEPLKPQYVTRLFDNIREHTGLPKMTFHGQRHESASLLLAAGTDIALVSKILGHSSIAITSDTYSHLIGSAAANAAQAAAALVPRRADAHTLHTQGT
jgi:integrase